MIKTKHLSRALLFAAVFVFNGCSEEKTVLHESDPCAGQNCSGHGTCAVVGGDTAVCICDPGYRSDGLSCVPFQPGNECEGIDCSGHGTCVVIQGDPDYPYCECDPGYRNVGGTNCVPEGEPNGEACRCDYWSSKDASAWIPMPNPFGSTPRYFNINAAFNGTDTLAFLTGSDATGLRDGRVFFVLRNLDGNPVGSDLVLTEDGMNLIGIGWSGTRWVVAWSEGDPPEPGCTFCGRSRTGSYIALLNMEGNIVSGPKSLDPNINYQGMTVQNDKIYLDYMSSGKVLVQTLDGSLDPLGPPIELSTMNRVVEMTSHEDSVSVIGRGEPGTTVYHALIRGNSLVSEVDLQQISNETNVLPSGRAAQDTGGLVVCWTWQGGISCKYLNKEAGTSMTPAFLVSLDTTAALDLARASCAMALMTGRQFSSGSAGSFHMYHFDQAGDVQAGTIDRQWIQPRRTMRLFPTASGGLIRILDACTQRIDDMQEVLISNLMCREQPAPVDCDELNDLMEYYQCGYCTDPDSTFACRVATGNGFSSGRPEYTPVDCEKIDAPRCYEDLQEPQECGGEHWLIPANCSIPL